MSGKIGPMERENELTQLSLPLGEMKLNKLHSDMRNKRRRAKIIARDVEHERRERLKSFGATESAKRRRLHEKAQAHIEKLKLLGLWRFYEKKGELNLKEIRFIGRIQREYTPPIVDPYSSDGFRIYPNLASWYVDIYGGEAFVEKREKEEEGCL